MMYLQVNMCNKVADGSEERRRGFPLFRNTGANNESGPKWQLAVQSKDGRKFKVQVDSKLKLFHVHIVHDASKFKTKCSRWIPYKVNIQYLCHTWLYSVEYFVQILWSVWCILILNSHVIISI
uniref:Uncharacterized protein n=1 Tax=Cacopsylla melanoneura TaxID=428564 RepID=A0A8D8RT36_9HEMI